MKATIHRPDGTRIELDGTPAEIREAIGVPVAPVWLSPMTAAPWWYPLSPYHVPTFTVGPMYTTTGAVLQDDIGTSVAAGSASYTVTPS